MLMLMIEAALMLLVLSGDIDARQLYTAAAAAAAATMSADDDRRRPLRAYAMTQFSAGRSRCLIVLFIIIGAAAAIAPTSKTFGRALKSKIAKST